MKIKLYSVVYSTVFMFVGVLLLMSSPLQACTGLFAKAEDGTVIYGRTMEFSMDLESCVVAVAKGHRYTGSTPTGSEGMFWESKYNVLGVNFFGTDFVADGMNEKGLQGGCFYFAQEAKYQDFSPENSGKALAPEEYVSWVLGNFKSVKEVAEHYQDAIIVNTVNKELKVVVPLHFLFVDRSGDSLVVEFSGKGASVMRNPVGVFTNNPGFDWHLKNLSNYVGLSTHNIQPKKINGMELKPFGQGTGMIGLPGDTTSPSRFVRGAFKLLSVTPFANAEDGLNKMFRVIKNFYITKGNVVGESKGEKVYEYTLWEVYKNLNDFVMYVDIYDDVNIKKVDGRKINFSHSEVQVFDLSKKQRFKDVTGKMRAK